MDEREGGVMTREQFEKAKELREKIKKYEDKIGAIRYGLRMKEVANLRARENIERYKNENNHTEKWCLSKFFELHFEKQKVVVVPHYEFATGVEIEADCELVNVILDYLEGKKATLEKEFEQIEV